MKYVGYMQHFNGILQLEECNCMIISKSLISSDFPWSMFNLVIEYEYEEQSAFCRECEVQNVTFVALKMDLKDVENNHQLFKAEI
jgi:hypothetical protein